MNKELFILLNSLQPVISRNSRTLVPVIRYFLFLEVIEAIHGWGVASISVDTFGNGTIILHKIL